MSNNDNFYQFVVRTPKDPIAHLKNILDKKKTQVSSAPNEDVRLGYTIAIKNLEDFLNFVATSSENVEHLEKTNVDENGMGIDTVIMAIQKAPYSTLSPTDQKSIVSALYFGDDPRKVLAYFEVTSVPEIYIWWEKGTTRQESFGTAHDNVFRGFVKHRKFT